MITYFTLIYQTTKQINQFQSPQISILNSMKNQYYHKLSLWKHDLPQQKKPFKLPRIFKSEESSKSFQPFTQPKQLKKTKYSYQSIINELIHASYQCNTMMILQGHRKQKDAKLLRIGECKLIEKKKLETQYSSKKDIFCNKQNYYSLNHLKKSKFSQKQILPTQLITKVNKQKKKSKIKKTHIKKFINHVNQPQNSSPNRNLQQLKLSRYTPQNTYDDDFTLSQYMRNYHKNIQDQGKFHNCV